MSEEGQIRNHRQARTAEQYLERLDEEMLDENMSTVELQFKQYETQIIQFELQDFYANRSIRLVVDNTINKEEEMSC